MGKIIYKIRYHFNMWYRERQVDDAYIDMLDAKIWWLKGKI